ncbi:flagellar filament capping protein FliD [Chitinimonas naiadis]
MNLSSIANTLNRTYGLYSDDLFLQRYRAGQIDNATAGSSAISSTQVRLSGYGRLQSALSDLGNIASRYDTPNEVATYSAKSDKSSITASVDQPQGAVKTLAVQVTQLAQSQRLQSQAFADADTTQLGGGSLTFQSGSIGSGGSVTANGPSRTVNISASDSTLNGIATAVNRANIGISAKVVQDGSNSRLEFIGKSTGGNQAFRIQVGDNDGGNSDSSQGLSRLAYDPAAGQGVGQNLTSLRSAQDAQLQVDGRPLFSASNSFRNAVPGIGLSVSETGSANITISRDSTQAGKSAKALADAYNAFLSQSANVPADGLTRRIGSSVDQALDGAEVGTGQSRLTLAQAGIARSQDGKLAVNEQKFQQAFTKDAEGVSKLLASVADRLENAGSKAQSDTLRTTSNALRGNADGSNPYSRQANQLQERLGLQNSLLSYSPTTRNLYGLSQYLSISGL